MTLKGGTSQACAACKHQRRKCTSECLLAPYFPADQPKIFRNVHKLFGVRNMITILKSIHNPQLKQIAMRSIIDQANMRDWYPVHGCYGVIQSLHYQIQQVREELHAIYAQLELQRQHDRIASVPEDIPPSQLELGMAPPNNGLPLFQQQQQQQQPYDAVAVALPIPQQPPSNAGDLAAYNCTYVHTKDNVPNVLWIQGQYTDNDCSMVEMAVPQTIALPQEIVQDYDELQPFIGSIEDRQSYMDSKEACESSSESPLGRLCNLSIVSGITN